MTSSTSRLSRCAHVSPVRRGGYFHSRWPHDVAEDSRPHQVRQLGHLEDVHRALGVQLTRQRRQSAERPRRGSAHTGRRELSPWEGLVENNQSLERGRGLTRRGPRWGRPCRRSPLSPGWGARRCCWWGCLDWASGGGPGSVSHPERSHPVEMRTNQEV